MITAKIFCVSKTFYGSPQTKDTVRLEFQADYSDGRNKEWAQATPHLNLSMTVKGEVSDRFEAGKTYTLQFEENNE